MIPYGRQNISEDDIKAITEVLESDFLTQGPQVPDFEDQIARYCGALCAVATNSATSALHIACLALDLGPNDYLWTSPISFVASANCGLYCGASINFVDIDPSTYNICAQALEKKLIEAEQLGTLPKIVVAVHMAGQSCAMQEIHFLSKRFGFRIIEDASHAIGGRYLNQTIGNCQYSDITIFSFHPVKIITSAEGGMALTNDAALLERMRLYRSHGITRTPSLMDDSVHGPWHYQQVTLGFNYRMTDIHAALGISQLKRLDYFIEKRHILAARYNELLTNLPITLPLQNSKNYSSFHLYIIRLKLKEIKNSHLEIFNSLRDQGIGVNLHYIPIHLQPYYKRLGFREGDYPMAEQYYKEAISIPIYPDLTLKDQDRVINSLKHSIFS